MARNITPDCIDGGQSFSLSSEQLAAIVEITGYSFGNEQGKEIEILCREYLIERDFERGAVPSIGAREITSLVPASPISCALVDNWSRKGLPQC